MAMTFGSSSSAGYEAVFQMAGNDIPINEGCYRCITVISPYGKLTNIPYPHASMAGNSEGQPVVIDMLISAFAQFSDQAPAPDADSCGLIAFGGWTRDPSCLSPTSVSKALAGAVRSSRTATACNSASSQIAQCSRSKSSKADFLHSRGISRSSHSGAAPENIEVASARVGGCGSTAKARW